MRCPWSVRGKFLPPTPNPTPCWSLSYCDGIFVSGDQEVFCVCSRGSQCLMVSTWEHSVSPKVGYLPQGLDLGVFCLQWENIVPKVGSFCCTLPKLKICLFFLNSDIGSCISWRKYFLFLYQYLHCLTASNCVVKSLWRTFALVFATFFPTVFLFSIVSNYHQLIRCICRLAGPGGQTTSAVFILYRVCSPHWRSGAVFATCSLF